MALLMALCLLPLGHLRGQEGLACAQLAAPGSWLRLGWLGFGSAFGWLLLRLSAGFGLGFRLDVAFGLIWLDSGLA